jgi:type VI secretion system secreted protein VgrG
MAGKQSSVLQITTPFGADALRLVRLAAEEAISSPFRLDLELLSREASLDFKKILGRGVTAKVALSGGKTRYFHGIVTRFVQACRAGEMTTYRAEVRPRSWLLGKTRDSRVYQNQSVPEIVKAIFSEHGVSPVEDKLKGKYEKREYCVQHQESAADFVSRLLEDEGIFYYFKHADGEHTLVLGDDSTAHLPCPNLPTARCRGEEATSLADEDVVISCEIDHQVTVGGYAVSDFNFEMPETSLLSTVSGSDQSLSVFEYPGNHAAKGAGESRAKLRLEAEEASGSWLSGESYCRAMSAGHTFKLQEHERAGANIDYALLSVTHSATEQEYANSFVAFPKSVPFRPHRVTPKPLIHGAQTAIVTGKSGEEIWTDKHGRIKVHFHWDRLGKKDEKSSCWVRVSQGWAGKGWGAFFLPRVGQEVVVTFLGGDPDRPLVTGSVYNAQQTTPYSLPSEQTKSTMKSRSSKEGSGGNEIRFEDKKDAEELLFHAEKDHNVTVKHDRTTRIDNDEKVTVKKNRAVTVEEGDQTLTVSKGKRVIDVKAGDETHAVKGKRDLKIGGAESRETGGAFLHKAKGGYTLKVTGDLTFDVSGAVVIKAGTSISIKAGTAANVEAGTALTNKAGTELTNKAGTNLTNDAGVTLMNKAGASQTVDGGGMLTVKGGLVKIN